VLEEGVGGHPIEHGPPRDFCCRHKVNLKREQSQFGFARILSLNTVIGLEQGGGPRRSIINDGPASETLQESSP
jgi:hypothetical protein